MQNNITSQNTSRLISTIKLPLQEEHRKRLAVIASADYSGVIRKTKEYYIEIGKPVSDEYLSEGIFGLQQYYAVALLDPANAHAVSAPVDPFWHFHILHTQDYFSFCDQVVGEYMHHQPLNHAVETQVENVRTLYQYTIEILDKIFTEVNPHFWPEDFSDAAMICFHKGNQELYPSVQPIRLFAPDVRGRNYAFAE
jgi:hypothetical protein